jgi:hypothetical protein
MGTNYATLLDIVKGTNTGLLLADTLGPLIQQLINAGKIDGGIPVTDADLKASSVSLGVELDGLHDAIERKIARDAAKSG